MAQDQDVPSEAVSELVQDVAAELGQQPLTPCTRQNYETTCAGDLSPPAAGDSPHARRFKAWYFTQHSQHQQFLAFRCA